MNQWLTPQEQEVIMWALSEMYIRLSHHDRLNMPTTIKDREKAMEIIFELIDKSTVME